MRPWLFLAAIALVPAVAAAEHLEVTLPAWCAEGLPDEPRSLVEVRARSDLDQVDVDGTELQPVGVAGASENRAFVGEIDLLDYLGDRFLTRPTGDIVLTVVAAGRGWIRVEQPRCRVVRRPMDLLKARMPAIIGKPNAWAAPFRPPGKGITNRHLLVDASGGGGPFVGVWLSSAYYRSVQLWRLGDVALFAVAERDKGGGRIVRVYSARTGGLIATRRFKDVPDRDISDWIDRSYSVEQD